jgi:two-component system copper resistance phosphate regulon response regulator CusR
MKILIAEDDRDMVRLMCTVLRKEKFTLDTAYTGEAAYEKAKTGIYDLIIMDLKLPNKHGFDIIAQLRVLDIKTPIIIVSSCIRVEDRVKGLNLGADDYLLKHFSTKELVARVKALLRRRHQIRRNILKHKDVLVNLENMSASRGGHTLDLSKKEFGIFLELLRHKDCIVSRQDLMKSVWDDPVAAKNSNTIDVHIKTLRKKIERSFPDSPPIIKTVRGYGYMVESK